MNSIYIHMSIYSKADTELAFRLRTKMILLEEFRLLSLEEKNLEILKSLPNIIALGEDFSQVLNIIFKRRTIIHIFILMVNVHHPKKLLGV